MTKEEILKEVSESIDRQEASGPVIGYVFYAQGENEITQRSTGLINQMALHFAITDLGYDPKGKN